MDEVPRIRRVCVTGPECSGKTTLAQRLAGALTTEWVPEAARLYAQRVARTLTVDDYEPIAREHVALARAAETRVRAAGGPWVVLDTDLLSTIVYAQHYYGETTDWLQQTARARLADLYLLCDVDVEWVPDGIRDRPEHRDEMFGLFSAEVARQQANVVVIRGGWDERFLAAMDAMGPLLI